MYAGRISACFEIKNLKNKHNKRRQPLIASFCRMNSQAFKGVYLFSSFVGYAEFFTAFDTAGYNNSASVGG